MEKLVMKGTPITPTLKTERSAIFTMSRLLEGVDYDENAIGYSLYYYKNTMIDRRDVRPNVRLIAVDGVEPNPATISSRQYPYVFSIYAVTRQDEPRDSKAYDLKEWLTSKEGQELIEKAGYVGLDN